MQAVLSLSLSRIPRGAVLATGNVRLSFGSSLFQAEGTRPTVPHHLQHRGWCQGLPLSLAAGALRHRGCLWSWRSRLPAQTTVPTVGAASRAVCGWHCSANICYLMFSFSLFRES